MTNMVNDVTVGEEGFTLVELLTAIFISMIVLLASLQSLDVFTSSAAQQTRLTDANDQVRSTVDRVTRDFRGASAIVRAESDDLVYTVPDAAGVRTERLCVGSGELYGTSTVAAAVATPALECTGSKLATLQSTSSTGFTYDGDPSSATPELVRNVGLTVSLDASGGGNEGSSTLSASVARRSAGILNLTDDDLRATCNSAGALLNVSASIPGVGDSLTVTYSADGGISFQTPVTGANTFQIPRGITTVLARVTNAAGVTKIIRRDVECGDEGS